MKIYTEPMPEVTISRFRRMQPVVDFSPPYQREGGVWRERDRARLIDSIINGLDMPKIYFEVVTERKKNPDGLSYQYAVIDGKQRLETIKQFFANELRLDVNFRYFQDESIRAAGMTLSDLEKTYPMLSSRFLDFELPIVLVTTDSDDLIDEMFQRLNASSSINAAERRNAVRGPTRDSANALAEHALLVSRSPIRNARYKYRELAAKFLAIEHQLDTREKIVDTKADTLYSLFVATRDKPLGITEDKMESYQESAKRTLDRMADVFEDDDGLLVSIGTLVVYYIAFREQTFVDAVDRERLNDFEHYRREANQDDEREPTKVEPAHARLREYSGLVQSTNDGGALTRRAVILRCFVEGYTDEEPLAGLKGILDEVPPELNEEDDA